MKKKTSILIGLLIALPAYYFVDKEVYMKRRVLRHHLWNFSSGEMKRGGFLYTENAQFYKNRLILNAGKINADTVILVYQYFGTMKIRDVKTHQSSVYCMYGNNWIDYLLE